MTHEIYRHLTSDSEVVNDANSFSVSGTWSIRTSTFMELGVLSGRAIMSVGDFVLKGVETVQIRKALFAASLDVRNLQRQQESGPLPDRTIKLLLELQR